MSIRKMIIFNCVIILLSHCIFSQTKFVGSYNGDNLKLDVQINKIILKKNDTLELVLKYYNISNDTLVLLNDNGINQFGNEFMQYLRIENGGTFEPGIERNIDLTKLDPNDSLILSYNFDHKFFNSIKINSFWGIFISLGYISDINKIYNNANQSDHKIHVLDSNKLKVSSLIVFPSLSFKEFTALIFRVLQKE